jgi:hypothetical protein
MGCTPAGPAASLERRPHVRDPNQQQRWWRSEGFRRGFGSCGHLYTAPGAPSHRCDQFEFAPLIVLAQRVATEVGREAALRAERQAISRDVAGCLVDAPEQVVRNL